MNKRYFLLAPALLIVALIIAATTKHESKGAAHAHTEDEVAPEHSESRLIQLTDEQIAGVGIETAMVRQEDLRQWQYFPGEIRLDDSSTVHVVPRATGIVESVVASLGKAVEQGDVLAIISSQQISEQRNVLKASAKRLAVAESSWQREKTLWEGKVSSRQDLQLAEQALQEAQIALADARHKTSALSGNFTALGGNRYEIRAPIAGTVVALHLVTGEGINETTNVLTLADLSRTWAFFGVTPEDLEKITLGASVTLLDERLGLRTTGIIEYVAPVFEERTRTASVRVSVDNSNGEWRPGLFVSVLLPGNIRNAALTVPDQALQNIDGITVVFVREEQGFSVRPVVVGSREAGRAEIISGLAPSEVVATTASFVLKSELGKDTAQHAH